MKQRVDINCDMGESYGKNSSDSDIRIMPYISSCNIACGFHSGDPMTIERTITAAIEHQLAIGAHPSFPDLQGFGRRRMDLSGEELGACIRYQVGALKSMLESLGGQLHHVKFHGALYHLVAADLSAAESCTRVLYSLSKELKVYGPPDSCLEIACRGKDLPYRIEGFADRQYEEDLSLRSRRKKGAVLSEDEALEQVMGLVLRKEVMLETGAVRDLAADTICLHSDTQGAETLARIIHQKLEENDVEIHAF
jgi:UPF0271 protein